MAGTGRAPKPRDQRRSRAKPQRGDWVELQAPKGKAPALPSRGRGRGQWSPRTRRAWGAWRTDPASTQWSVGDVELVEHLVDVFEEWVRDPRANMASEIRQLRDSLGLTPKGKLDRGWAVADEAPANEQPAGVTALADYREKLQGKPKPKRRAKAKSKAKPKPKGKG